MAATILGVGGLCFAQGAADSLASRPGGNMTTTIARTGRESTQCVAVEEAMRHYAHALRSFPADSVAACFAEDGELLLPGLPPVHGRSAIRDFLAPMKDAVVVDSTEMTSDYLNGSVYCATQWGTYRQVAGPKGGVHDVHVGRYSAVWITHVPCVGPWYLYRLMMQPMPTPAAPAPSSAPPPAH